MFSLKANNIYDVTKSLHFFSGLLGFSSFSVKKVNHNFVQYTNSFNILCIAYSTFCNIALIVIYLTCFDTFYYNSLRTSEIFQTSMHIIVVFFLLISVLINWWSFFARKYYPAILNIFAEIDEEFCKIKLHLNFKKHKNVILIFVLLTKVLMGFLAFLLQEHSEIKDPLYFVGFYSTFTYFEFTTLTTSQYLYWIWAVKLRYRKINMYLSKHFFSDQLQTLESGSRKLNISALLHEKLVDASEAINQYYGIPVKTIEKL